MPMHRLIRAALLVLLLAPLQVVHAQNKEEKEKRISDNDLPAKTIAVLKPFLEDATGIKFYYEIDGDHKSYEAKFKYGGSKYSIEFDSTGMLEDVEVIVNLKSLPEPTRKEIKSYLETFQNNKIFRLQKQFTSKDDDQKTIAAALADQGQIIRYEMVVGIKEDKVWNNFELLFDESGIVLEKRKVISRSSDYILY